MRAEPPKIRVLIVFSSGDIGGAEASLTRMAAAGEGERVQYHLATLGEGTGWRDWAHDLGVDGLSFPVMRRRQLGISALVSFVRTCRDLDPHVIYLVGMRAAILVRGLKLLLKDPILVHAIRSSFPKGTRLASKMALTERIFGAATDHYVANSHRGAHTLTNLVRIPQTRISVIHNGIHASGASPHPPPDDISRVVVVANINQYKGHVDFLRVVARLRKNVPALEIVFVGRDELGGTVQREIERLSLADVVRLVGYVNEPEQYIDQARVVALPSREIEGSPTAILEAMARGRPVVAYRVGGLSEIVQTGVNGVLVEQGDEEGLVRALERLLLDRALAERFGRAAREAVMRSFTIERCAQEHADLWSRLVTAER